MTAYYIKSPVWCTLNHIFHLYAFGIVLLAGAYTVSDLNA